MAEENAPPHKQPKFRRALEFAASAFKVVVEMIGAAAALIAILQAFRRWP